MKVLSLFSGIGAFEKALERIGIDYELVNYCEIDKYASRSYSAIHNVDESMNLIDVTKINPSELPDFDLLTHGSPCQDFSSAGRGAGGNKNSGTRSSLMWNTVDIIKTKIPSFVMWENVLGLLEKNHKHNFDRYLCELEKLGYNNYWKKLNAKNYGIPHNRDRIFVVSIHKSIDDKRFVFPKQIKLKLLLRDLLEDDVPLNYYLSEEQTSRFKFSKYPKSSNGVIGTTRKDGAHLQPAVHKIDGIMSCLSATEYKRPQQVMLNQVGVVDFDEKPIIRKLTPLECWRLMGFDDEDFYKCQKFTSNTQLYKQAGNSIVVNVLEAIFRNLLLKEERAEYVQTDIFDFVE